MRPAEAVQAGSRSEITERIPSAAVSVVCAL